MGVLVVLFQALVGSLPLNTRESSLRLPFPSEQGAHRVLAFSFHLKSPLPTPCRRELNCLNFTLNYFSSPVDTQQVSLRNE